MEILLRALSSLDRVFPDFAPESADGSFMMLRNEIFSFQAAFTLENQWDNAIDAVVSIESPISKYVTVRRVANVPVMRPVYASIDEFYGRTAPGLYPDPLMPVYEGRLRPLRGVWQSLFITVNPDRKTLSAGTYPVKVKLTAAKCSAELEVSLTVINACLPEQELICTNWLHCDCIADAHGCKPFSRRFWTILAKYVRTAVLNGQNMVLTPAFTPPLDTPVGGERMTVQLVGVEKTADGYRFDFSRLDRFIKLCEKQGIRYFEHSHLFTQWGAAHAPKIMATVDGEYKRIFGWETDAAAPEYVGFLTAYLTELKKHLDVIGVGRRMYFHISDEPTEKNIESYSRAKKLVAGLLEGYTQFDALHAYEFYEKGLVTTPVAGVSHINDFIGRCDDLWAYYIGMEARSGYSNRLISVPPERNRILGAQLYRFGIKGFLHWGYNFWYTTNSRDPFDPYLGPDADMSFAGGTSYLVYPGEDGPVESSRLVVFGEGIQDHRAMKLLESLVGREAVEALLEDAFPKFSFSSCPRTPAELLSLRDRVYGEIAKRIK